MHALCKWRLRVCKKKEKSLDGGFRLRERILTAHVCNPKKLHWMGWDCIYTLKVEGPAEEIPFTFDMALAGILPCIITEVPEDASAPFKVELRCRKILPYCSSLVAHP